MFQRTEEHLEVQNIVCYDIQLIPRSLFNLRHVCWACMLSISDTLLYIHSVNSHFITISHSTIRWLYYAISMKGIPSAASFPTSVTFRNVSWTNSARWWSDIHLSTELVCWCLKEILWRVSSANFLCGGNHNVHSSRRPHPAALQKTVCFCTGGISGQFTQILQIPLTGNTHTKINSYHIYLLCWIRE